MARARVPGFGWLMVALALVLAQVAATLLLPKGPTLTFATDANCFLLMVLVGGIFASNAARTSGRLRLFWVLLASCWATRSAVQLLWIYFDVVLRANVSNPFAGDVLFFLSNTPVLAALLLQSQGSSLASRRAEDLVDFALLLCWWLYLFIYFVLPWHIVSLNEKNYGTNYDRLNLLLDVLLLLVLAFLIRRSSGKWRMFYVGLLLAQVFITFSGYLSNEAMVHGVYYSGSLYDLPYAAAVAAFTICGTIGNALTSEAAEPQISGKALPSTKLGMLALVSMPIITCVSVLAHRYPASVTHFREFVIMGTVLVMAILVFIRQSQMTAQLSNAADELQEAAITDLVTGARNRRFLEAVLPKDVSRVVRAYETESSPEISDLVFYMVDLDNFKEINDCFGHARGDAVLVEAARRIKSVMRDSDILVRWGGDEFLVVSRYADRATASHLAMRLLQALAQPTDVDNPIRTTCSIGWAAFPWYQERPNEVSVDAVLGLADRALYRAKSAGKNRAVGFCPNNGRHDSDPVVAGDWCETVGLGADCLDDLGQD